MNSANGPIFNENRDAGTTNWRLWCRLCAKEDAQNINVFCKDEQPTVTGSSISGSSNIGSSLRNDTGGESSLANTIHKYFGVQITREEQLPQMLCTECFSVITSLVNFVERVGKVQLMYNELQNLADNSDLNPQGIRLKYDLLDEERHQIFMQQSSPEVYYLETKPKVNELVERVFDADTETSANNPLENVQPRITLKIKKERLVEDAAHTDEDTCEYDNTNEDLADPFGSDTSEVAKSSLNALGGCDARKDDVEDDINLATLRTKINTKRKSSHALEGPFRKMKRRGRKRKSYFSSMADADDIDDIKSDVETQLNRLEHNDQQESFIYNCNECPQRFKRLQNYRLHMKRKHNSTLPQVNCNQCPCVFNTQKQLERHSLKHLPLELKRIIPCPYCDKKFTTKGFIATHIKFVHMNERSFICEECGDAVRTSAALREHMLTHTDYAPFECDICQKGFKNQSRLKKHKEIHDQNKHICAECGLQLNSRTTLNRHLLVHSDKMQHKCDYCGRAFKRGKALKSHLILHTGLKPYSCDFCDRTFANGSNCRTHKKKSHPKELAELEASGGKTYTKNIPRIEALRAVTKAADNLTPVVSKQSGNFAFGKKPELSPSDAGTVRTKAPKAQRQLVRSNNTSAALPPNVPGDDGSTVIPTIDNIYSHLMKQAIVSNPVSDTLPDIVDGNTWHYRNTHETCTQ